MQVLEGSRVRPVPFVARLADHGDRVAVIADGLTLTYSGLARRVDDVAATLGPTRRLVLLAGGNRLDTLVTYLACLHAGHVVLLIGDHDAEHVDALVQAYDPDVVAADQPGGWRLTERRTGSAHDLHPELALLLSTSGSTGSPKLVRLSAANLQANAEAIADYLEIRATDRAATTLPMHYCYGLSVVHSHLLSGAGLVLTDLSVVDRCFWDLVAEHQVSSLAGVPYTFELLDRVGFAEMDLPSLRYVTQAGGRLAAERVRVMAELGRRKGFDFVVMYGQTEATARMAYLPPDLAVSHPHTIGAPIPGGAFSIEPIDNAPGSDVGELVYSGPNVMLGYAESPADLALGRTVDRLHTGDLARRLPEGVYEVVGRRSRFVKIAGLRVDLQRLEGRLAERGYATACTGGDERLVVAVEGAGDPEPVQLAAARAAGLPARAVRIVWCDELPRLDSGKPDYATVLARAATISTANPGSRPTDLREIYAQLLNRPDATEDDTFVSLGGDSLSYVEMSMWIEEVLGHLPGAWHVTPIRDLRAAERPRRRRFTRTVETSVAIRAAAIVLIVGTHAQLFSVLGSAHVLFAVAGYNFARFQLTTEDRWSRVRHQLGSVSRVVIPAVVWIAAVHLVTGAYTGANIALLNSVVGPSSWDSTWHYWFIEMLVYVLVGMAALSAVPWLDRAERRWPFVAALAVLALGLLVRYDVLSQGIGPVEFHPQPVLWLFALGWSAARATTVWQRALLTVVVVATVPGFFDNPSREAVMVGGIVLLVWASGVPCPAPVAKVATIIASASLYIYLVHWQVYEPLRLVSPALATLAALGAGVLYWLLVTGVTRLLSAQGAPRLRLPAVRAGQLRRSPARPRPSDMATAPGPARLQ